MVEAANEPIRIAVSRSHNTDETFEHISRIKQRYPSAVVIQQGSSYKFCLLAEAVVDVYVRTSPTSEWDTAAGEVILLESGGRVENITGGRLDYNKETLRNPHLSARTAFGGIDPGLLRFAGTDLRKDSRRTDLSAGTTSAGGLRRRGTSCLLRSLNTGEFHNKVN